MTSILHIIDSNGRGGAELMLKDFIVATQQEYDHTVFALAKSEHAGVHSDFFGLGVETIKNLCKTTKILRELKSQNQFDIIHAHLPLSGLLGRWVFRDSKFIVHVHNELSKQHLESIAFFLNSKNFSRKSHTPLYLYQKRVFKIMKPIMDKYQRQKSSIIR